MFLCKDFERYVNNQGVIHHPDVIPEIVTNSLKYIPLPIIGIVNNYVGTNDEGLCDLLMTMSKFDGIINIVVFSSDFFRTLRLYNCKMHTSTSSSNSVIYTITRDDVSFEVKCVNKYGSRGQSEYGFDVVIRNK